MRFAPNRPGQRLAVGRGRPLWLAVLVLLIAGAGAYLWLQQPARPEQLLEAQARRYVELALLSLDATEIDGYFGAATPATAGPPQPPEKLRQQVQDLASELGAAQALLARRARLLARTEQLDALLGIIAAPRSLDFDAEAAKIYGMAPAEIDQAAQDKARRALDQLLPGPGSLIERVTTYRSRFLLPPDKRKLVFARALAECRARTLARWQLPAAEAISIEWTDAVPAAWHRYLGRYQSRLQINPAAVADPATAIDLACHEAYPGHHAQFVLLEARSGAVPVEDTIVLLRSPESALREGAANHGIALAFPAQERAEFMARTLFPLVGFPPADAMRHARIHQLIGTLAMSTVPALRRLRGGSASREQTRAALAHDALISSPDALLAYFDRYGALVLGYTAAQDRVAACVDAAPDPWAALADLMVRLDTSLLGAKTACPPGP